MVNWFGAGAKTAETGTEAGKAASRVGVFSKVSKAFSKLKPSTVGKATVGAGVGAATWNTLYALLAKAAATVARLFGSDSMVVGYTLLTLLVAVGTFVLFKLIVALARGR